jgi:hypothetical protein
VILVSIFFMVSHLGRVVVYWLPYFPTAPIRISRFAFLIKLRVAPRGCDSVLLKSIVRAKTVSGLSIEAMSFGAGFDFLDHFSGGKTGGARIIRSVCLRG